MIRDLRYTLDRYEAFRDSGDRLFVYGTLREGQPLQSIIEPAVLGREVVTVRGHALWLFGHDAFPYMIKHDYSDAYVIGEALRVDHGTPQAHIIDVVDIELGSGYRFGPVAEGLWGFTHEPRMGQFCGHDWLAYVNGRARRGFR